MKTYRVFKRAARSFEEFAKARKVTVQRGLPLDAASALCTTCNMQRSASDRERGLKYEFEEE